MSDVNTSYVFAPACDTRTMVSMGIALLVTAIVAAALSVLAHLEYINPVIAYSVGPASGILLILIGAALSSIRSHSHLQESLAISLDSETPKPLLPQIDPCEIRDALLNPQSKIVSFETGEIVKIHSPDEKHPYFYGLVRLELEGRFADLEYYSHETKKVPQRWDPANFFITVQYQKKHYSKQVESSLQERVKTDLKDLKDNYFDESRYWGLTCGQPARMFLKDPKNGVCWADGENKIIFKIPDYKSFSLKELARNINQDIISVTISFKRSRASKPPYPIEAFNPKIPSHKRVIDLLKASKWLWKAPGEITKVTPLEKDSIEVTYFRKQSA